MNEITEKQREMMRHALGANSGRPGFRNHYCAATDDPLLCDLVARGLMTYRKNVFDEMGNSGLFHVTAAGQELIGVKASHE